MKIRLFYLFVLLVALVSCKKENSDVKYDFSVLGTEKIVIDESVITLDSCGSPVKDSKSFVIVGFTNGSLVREYDLAVLNTGSEEKNIAIKSKYKDVLVKIEKSSDLKVYTITLSRTGFEEKIVYKIGFIKTLNN